MGAARHGITVGSTAAVATAPWVLCLLVLSRPHVALVFLLTSLVLMLGGLALVRVISPKLRVDSWVLLSFPAGVVQSCFVTSVAVRGGIDLRAAAVVLLFLGVVGVCVVIKHRAVLLVFSRSVVRTGPAVVAILMSFTICAFYFAPSVAWDGTLRPDGSYRWLYIDCQWFMATTTSIIRGGVPPDMPGLAGAPLWYHYGRLALAATVERVSSCDVAESLFGVVGGVGRMSLALAALALGRALGASRGGRLASGLFGVFGLFFVGWVTWPLTAQGKTFSMVNLPRKIQEILALPPEHWEPFQHVLHSHSLLWGAIGLVLVLTLLIESAASERAHRSWFALPLVPALIVPVNGIAALGAAGVTWAEVAYRHRRHLPRLLAVIPGVVATVLSYWHLLRPQELAASRFSIDPDPRQQLLWLFMYFFLGHGVLLVGLKLLSSFRRSSAARVLAIVAAGFLTFTVLFVNRDWNDHYGIRMATVVIVIFSTARIGSWLGDDPLLAGRRALRELGVVIIVTAGVFVLLSLGVIVLVGPGSIGVALLPFLATAMAGIGCLLVWLSGKNGIALAIGMAALGFIFLFQSMAWVPIVVVKGFQRAQEVKLSAGEVEGLVRLKRISESDDLCITNRHAIPGRRFRPHRSYMYTALSERAFVLEGWEYREMSAPGFQDARDLSEAVFATRDPEALCSSLRERGVDYIVARPGTDLTVAEDACDCVRKVPDTGTLNVYRVR